MFKGIRPEDMDPLGMNDPLQVEPSPGAEVSSEDEDTEDSSVIENEDGSVTVNLGDDSSEPRRPEVGFGDNLAEIMDWGDLGVIGSNLLQLIREDDSTREEGWKERLEHGFALLGLTYEDRSEPFKGATGVVHTLLHEALCQFQAQAYKELLPAQGPARTLVLGSKTPEKEARAARVKDYLNYQITEVMEEFDPDFDQMLYHLGLVGSTFKKVYRDDDLGRCTSPYIEAMDLIVPNYARDLMTSPRVTQVVRVNENDLRKQMINGFYRLELGLTPSWTAVDDVKDSESKAVGIDSQSPTPGQFVLYECHTELDLPGFEDLDDNGDPTGIALPYVVTIESTSGKVLGIRRNYREADPLRKKRQYFVHYKLMPGLGFYGFGLVHILGNMGQAATSLLRQLIDAGTLSNLRSGFKAKGLRVSNSDEPLQPGEWRDVDTASGDLTGALVPVPTADPSPTLFQLLGFLVGAAEKFMGTSDLGVGNNMNQEIPVGSVIALLERGTRIQSSTHKRLFYAMKRELRLIARTISENMSDEYPYDVAGGERSVMKSDFSPDVSVLPVADPNIFSMTQRVTLAQEQLKMAQQAPEIHNKREAYRRMYVALGVQDIDDIIPPEKEPEPVTPAAEHALLLVPQGGAPLKAFQEQDHELHLKAHQMFQKLPLISTMTEANAALLQHMLEHINFRAKQLVIESVQKSQDPQLMALIKADPEFKSPPVQRAITALEQQLFEQYFGPETQGQQQQDPLVMLKARELDLKEQDQKAQQQSEQQKLALEQSKAVDKSQMDRIKLQEQTRIADERNRIAQTRNQMTAIQMAQRAKEAKMAKPESKNRLN
jgi:hypothetical protein